MNFCRPGCCGCFLLCRPAVAHQAGDRHLQRVGGGQRVAVEQPLRGVVGVGLGQAVGVALGCDLLPVGEVEGDFE